jgi:hypothetical protein
MGSNSTIRRSLSSVKASANRDTRPTGGTFRIDRSLGARGRDVLKALPGPCQNGGRARCCFEPPKDHIAVGRIIFDQPGKPHGAAGSVQVFAARSISDHDRAERLGNCRRGGCGRD